MKTGRFSDAQVMRCAATHVYMCERGHPEASGRRRGGLGTLQRTWHEQRKFLQMACQIWRHGCFLSLRDEHAERTAEGSARKKVLRPSIARQANVDIRRQGRRREMAKNEVAQHQVSNALACRTFRVSETCYRYSPALSDENEEIADWLERPTTNKRTWELACAFCIFGMCGAMAGTKNGSIHRPVGDCMQSLIGGSNVSLN